MANSPTAEERLLKRVIARFRCEHCHRQHAADNVSIMGKYDAVWIVGVDCDGCGRAGMFVVSMRKDSSYERVTDLTEDEQERFIHALPVDVTEVEEMRRFLAGFKGNFDELFGEGED